MSAKPEARATGVHATAVVYGESGVLILGPTGSGKSALALALLARARGAEAFGALLGDDRVYVRQATGRLIVSGAPHMAGIIERRAAGLIAVGHEPAAIVRLAVELSERGRTWPRLPESTDNLTIAGVGLPRLALDSGRCAADQALAVDERLRILAADNSELTRISLEHCAAVHKNESLGTSPPARPAPDG